MLHRALLRKAILPTQHALNGNQLPALSCGSVHIMTLH